MKTIFNKNHLNDAILIVSLIAILAAFLSLACSGLSPSNNRGREWESSAKSTLLALGETELAYQSVNDNKFWGSWENLVDRGYIAQGYTRGNIIENYSLWMMTFHLPPVGPLVDRAGDSRFTIVAFPRITRPPGYLSTFALRDDETLRTYTPALPGENAWGENGDFGARTWEPIR